MGIYLVFGGLHVEHALMLGIWSLGGMLEVRYVPLPLIVLQRAS